MEQAIKANKQREGKNSDCVSVYLKNEQRECESVREESGFVVGFYLFALWPPFAMTSIRFMCVNRRKRESVCERE